MEKLRPVTAVNAQPMGAIALLGSDAFSSSTYYCDSPLVLRGASLPSISSDELRAE